MESTDVEVAKRVLKALDADDIPRSQDAYHLRILAPVDERMRPLRELAQAVIDKASQKKE